MTKPDSNLEREDVSVSQSQMRSGSVPLPVGEPERAAALASLLARVEVATGPDDDLDVLIFMDADPQYGRERKIAKVTIGNYPGYTGSLDAALALVERCKPGSEWKMSGGPETGDTEAWANAVLTTKNWPHERDYAAISTTPALALLAALLKALIADTASPALGRSQTEDEQS